MMRRCLDGLSARSCVDALRDRRTLLMVLLSSVAIGPLVLVLMSQLVAGIEKRAEAREVVVHGIEHAPTLRNYLERQTYTVREAPRRLRAAAARTASSATRCWWCRRTSRPTLARGKAPVVELLVSASATSARRPAAAAVLRLLRGFNQEQATLRLALRGVLAGAAGGRCACEERDLADPASRAAQLAGHGAVLRADGGALRRAECGAGHHGRRARARLAGAAADEPGRRGWRWCSASGARWPAWAC